jgi:hypothetical protein
MYNPCTPRGKLEFLEWFKIVDMSNDNDWLIIDDRNKLGANILKMFDLNEAIRSLSLIELPLKGIRYTWSNMQAPNPLFGRLECNNPNHFRSNNHYSWQLSRIVD